MDGKIGRWSGWVWFYHINTLLKIVNSQFFAGQCSGYKIHSEDTPWYGRLDSYTLTDKFSSCTMTILLLPAPVTHFFNPHCLFYIQQTHAFLVQKQSYKVFSLLVGRPVGPLWICHSTCISIFKYHVCLHSKHVFIYSLFCTFIWHYYPI